MNIYVMNADGSRIIPLTNDGISTAPLCWSPDGQYIAFTVVPKNPNFKAEIYMMKADGTNKRILIDFPSSNEGWPIWARAIEHIRGE